MSKFNTIIKKQSEPRNHEGAEAYRLSAEMELYSAVVTASLSDKFYERTMYGNEIQQLEIQRQMRQMATMLKNDDILRIPLGSEFDIKGHPVNITEMEDFVTDFVTAGLVSIDPTIFGGLLL